MKKDDCSCWKVMNCENPENCPTRSDPEKPCWENCYLQNDMQKVFEICKNCTVFINKNCAVFINKNSDALIDKKSALS